MKKTLKIRTAFVMALIACFSMVCGVVMLLNPAFAAKATTPATFEMLGASIRYELAEDEAENGIRFGFQLDKTAYDALIADENAEAGILICYADQYEDELTIASENATKGIVNKESEFEFDLTVGKWRKNADDNMQTWVFMTGIAAENFDKLISGRAYIDWNGDGTDVDYSDVVTKSIAEVAFVVRTDYEGDNGYETTEAQYTSLDGYLPTYDVSLIDAYGAAKVQEVKYGSAFANPAEPTERTGYVFKGWYEKIDETTYAEDPTDFETEEKSVYADVTYRAEFDMVGDVFEKPAIGSAMIGRGQHGWSVEDGAWQVQGDYFFEGATASKAEGFTISVTFIPEEGAEYDFLITDDLAAGHGRITYRVSQNNFNFYNYTDGEYNGETWAWYDSQERTRNDASPLAVGEPATMSMVLASGVYLVYINGERACSFIDIDGLQSGSSRNINDLVGSGDTLYLGFGAFNGPATGTTVTDWGFSKASVTGRVAKFASNIEPEPPFSNDNASEDANPQFEASATFKAGAAGRLGFIFREEGFKRFTVLAYDTESNTFGWFRFGIWGDYRLFTMSNDAYDQEGENTIKVAYLGNRVVDVYINGEKMIFTNSRAANEGSLFLGWNCKDNDENSSMTDGKPYQWWGTSTIDNRKTFTVGLFHADAYDFSLTVTEVAQHDDTGEISISSKEDWSKLNEHKEGTFVLTSDIDFGGEAITRIGDGFNGTIDGQGHKISNFTINSTNQSLFGTVGSAAVMKNIAFTNVTMVGGEDTALISTKDFRGTLQDIYVQYDSITGLDTSGSKRMGLVFGRNGAPYDGYVVPKNVIIDVTACASTLEANINDLNSTNGNAWKVLSGFGRWEGTNVDLDSCFLVGADYITICAGSVYTNSYTDYEALKNANKTYTGWNTTSMWTIVDGVPKANAVA